jgi:hypothetical protein
MPAASIDTFFACALMVLLTLSAMTSTTNLLSPSLNSTIDLNAAERYREISKHILLSMGKPSDWGQDGQTIPTALGLAKTDSTDPYDLDIDKVSRLNSRNMFSISYAQLFSALGMPDVSFRIEIKPVFEVAVNLTATYVELNQTVYQFEITTKNHGKPIAAYLRCYTIANDYDGTPISYSTVGKENLNITLSNTVVGSAMLVVLAKSTYCDKFASFNTCVFAHNSVEPSPDGTYLTLSPLNRTLTASFAHPGIKLEKVYAFTLYRSSVLDQVTSNNQSAVYSIPRFLDASPLLIVATGNDSAGFFAEKATYPQIPALAGADLANSTLSNVFAYTYLITIDTVLYECTIWLGGPRN